MSRWGEALIAAFQTLTRIPVPSPGRPPDAVTICRSAVFFPWIGALLGGLGWLLFQATAPLVGRSLAALGVLALWALLTGALHEDGLADAADAFGSQRDREGLLRVMKDSRIGSYGALALLLGTLARWTLLKATGGVGDLAAFVAAQSLGRAGVVALAVWAGPATDGMGSALARSAGVGHALAAGLPAVGLLLSIAPQEAPACVAAALLVVAAAAVYFRSRLGGVTGDCLGAAYILQEIVALAVLRGPAS